MQQCTLLFAEWKSGKWKEYFIYKEAQKFWKLRCINPECKYTSDVRWVELWESLSGLRALLGLKDCLALSSSSLIFPLHYGYRKSMSYRWFRRVSRPIYSHWCWVL